MKVIIEDFGPVREFVFDTDKKFHLIVGENNVGKSYALTAFYFVVKSILESFSAYHIFKRKYLGHYYFEESLEDPKSAGDQKILSAILKEKKSGDVDVTDFCLKKIKGFLQYSLVDEFSKGVRSSYHDNDSISNVYSGADCSRVTILLDKLKIVFEGDINGFELKEADFGFKVILRHSLRNRTPRLSNGRLVVYRNEKSSIEQIAESLYLACLVRVIEFFSDVTDRFVDIDYLPASRSGLYQALSAFGQIIAELSRSRSFVSSKLELPGISGQLSDYFIKLNGIKSGSATDGAFEDLAKLIESDVLKGRIEFDFEEKKLFYYPDGSTLKLDISAASSMISETAPVVAYIRHIIAWNSNDVRFRRRFRQSSQASSNLAKILIVEEPEAHLHPSNQIKMTRYYAELARLGVMVVMTSHSNYIFNKSSNLVIERVLNYEDFKCDLFHMTEQGSVGQAQEVDEYGIADGNFADSSEMLLNERMELIGKISE